MSVQALIDLAARYPNYLLIYFALAPIAAFILPLLHHKGFGNLKPWRYFYSTLIFWVCIPGTIALTLTAYSLFFIRQNLLEVNFMIYFLPIIAMFLTLVLIHKHAHFQRLPGFGRLTGFMGLIAISFLIVLLLYKTRILIGFFGSFTHLLILGIIIYFALKWSMRKFFA